LAGLPPVAVAAAALGFLHFVAIFDPPLLFGKHSLLQMAAT